ncbi:MAG: response regulator [Fimbriimonadaceae bacterium]|nr:response regulator [Chitinophagales bacterium]
MEDSKRILVVDDDPDIGGALKMMLEYYGYNVTLLNSAEQTEKTIQKNKIDLVILDKLIANINGVDVCSRIKKDSSTAHLPVLMISALPDIDKICLNAGADYFISKPFDMQHLVTTVSDLLSIRAKTI